MARPSMKAQRSEEILDAFRRCIVKYGMQGASLERIADEAGLARQILRHYVGNRDDLIVALTQWFVDSSARELEAVTELLPEENRLPALLDLLFNHTEAYDADLNMLSDALISEASRLQDVQKLFTAWFERLNKFITRELQHQYGRGNGAQQRAVALGIVSLLIVGDALHPITDSRKFTRDAHRSAQILVQSLAT